jgi:hypothetical protein
MIESATCVATTHNPSQQEVYRNMTAVTERQTREPRESLHGRVRNLTITVIVLAVALIGLAAWTIYDLASESETAISGEVQTLVDDYLGAWNDHDPDAFMGLVTDDYSFAGMGGEWVAAAQVASDIAGAEGSGWHVERVGEPIMSGDGPWFVSTAARFTGWTFGSEGVDGISQFVIVDDGGVLKIESHVYGLD